MKERLKYFCYLKEYLLGTKVREKEWATKHIREGNDWEGDSWIEFYCKHRPFLIEKIPKISGLFDIICLYKNWHIVLLYKIDIIKKYEIILRNGIRFKVRNSLDEPSIQDMFLRKSWTKFHKIKNNDVVIDIGAFIGDFAIFAASSAKNAKVFAYEPSRESFEYLVKNIKLNNLDNNIIPFDLAITNIKKKIKFYVNPENRSTDDSVYKIGNLLPSVVNSTTLEDVFKSNNIKYCNFLKMNCEGAEFDILLNTPKELFEKIGYIAMEYHWIGNKTKADYNDIVKILKDNNFKIEQEFTKEEGGYIFAKHEKLRERHIQTNKFHI